MALFKKKTAAKKPVKKKTTAKKTVKKKAPVKKTAGKKKPFGGYSICFKGCEETLEEVFSAKDITPSEMTKAIWVYVKKKNIAGKK
jgi:hypothetical protein